jgi:hypothetical protein
MAATCSQQLPVRTQVPDHLAQNRILRPIQFQGKRERGNSLFKGLHKPFMGGDQRKLKMRRSPPTAVSLSSDKYLTITFTGMIRSSHSFL